MGKRLYRNQGEKTHRDWEQYRLARNPGECASAHATECRREFKSAAAALAELGRSWGGFGIPRKGRSGA